VKKMPHPKAFFQWQIDKGRDLANELLKNESGTLFDSDYDYECFRYTDDGIVIIFYPHRTSARNYHIRVRDGGSKNKGKADLIMKMLDDGAGYNCTFQRKVK